MEKLQNYNRKRALVMDILLAVILSAGVFLCFKTSLGLAFSGDNLFGNSLPKSIASIWNIFADRIGSKDYILFDHYASGNGKYGGLLIAIYIAELIIAYFVIKSRNLPVLALYVFIGILPVLAGLVPSGFAVGLLFAGLILVIVYFKSNGNSSIFVVFAVVVAVSLSMMIGDIDFVKDYVKNPAPFQAIRVNTQKAVERIRYGSTSKNNSDTAFSITMDEPSELWLRGYVGEVHNKAGWVPFRKPIQYNYIPYGNALKSMGLNAPGQIGQVTEIVEGKEERVNVQIESKNISREYLLVPYGIADAEVKEGKNYGDSFFKGKGFFGAKKYSYDAVKNPVQSWTDIAGKVWKKADNTYRKAEAQQNSLVYSRFTELERDDIIAIHKVMGDPGDQTKAHIDYREAFEKIKKTLDKQLIYDEKSKEKETELSKIFDSDFASDYEFAAATAAMARYYGIPSRYVEGYLVTKNDVGSMKKGVAYDIPQKNFHAWAEIYIDGIGWVPFETVKEYENIMTQPDYSKGIDDDEFTNAFQPHKKKKSSSKEESEEFDDSRSNVPIKEIILFLLLAIIAIRIIYSLVMKAAVLIKRRKAFRSPDISFAVKSIYDAFCKEGLSVTNEVKYIGQRAAYSPYVPNEDERQIMLDSYKAAKKSERRAHK